MFEKYYQTLTAVLVGAAGTKQNNKSFGGKAEYTTVRNP